jgi:hypothetical protein
MKSLARFVTLLIGLTLAACNLPKSPSTPVPTENPQVATIVAATMQAAASATSMTPFASPAPPSATPTTQPTLSINVNSASCRDGPGANSKEIATFPSGTSLIMVAKDTADGYWIVQDPTSHDLCWIQAQDATPAGSYALLPEVTPQATARGVPAKPSLTAYTFQCVFLAGGGLQVKVQLRWTGNSTNETGYRVYRDSVQIADLPANSTSYSDTTSIASGAVYVYSVAAYNDTGTSPEAVTRGDPITC